jgi:hypothetical protein
MVEREERVGREATKSGRKVVVVGWWESRSLG